MVTVDHAGDQHADAADGVGDDLHVGALDGQAVRRVRAQQQRDDEVGGQRRPAPPRSSARRGPPAPRPSRSDRLVEDEHRDPDEQHGVGHRGEHLGAMPAVGAVGRRAAALGQRDGGQSHEHGHDVGEHVPGVGQQRDRVDQQRGGQFDDEERRQNRPRR